MENTTQEAPSDATPETEASESEVDVTSVPDSELDSFISSIGKEKEETEPKAQKEVAQTEDEQTVKPEDQEEETVTMSRSEVEALKTKLQKEADYRVQQEKFIQRRSTEIGELRRQLKEAKAQLQSNLDERFHESPSEAMEDVDKLKTIDSHLQALDKEEAQERHVATAQSVVAKNIDLSSVDMNEVIETLVSDGINDKEFLEEFAKNPWGLSHGETLVQLFKRTQERKEGVKAKEVISKLLPLAKQLFEENKKLKSKPEQILKNLSKNIKSSASINGSTGNAASKKSFADIDVTKLKDDELDELLKSI